MAHSISRRAILKATPALAASLALTAALVPPSAVAAQPADPALEAVRVAKALHRKFHVAHDKLDRAEAAFRKTAGLRPYPLIAWRNYSAVGGSELEGCRDRFLTWPDAIPAVVQAEYLDAKARLAQKVRDGQEWDRRAGLVGARKAVRRMLKELKRSEWAAARTVPTTPAGAAALLGCVTRELTMGMEDVWHLTAMKSVQKALRSGALN